MKRRRSRITNRTLTLARTGSVASATLLVVGGVAYTTLQSQQAKLTGNSIQTATASLQVSGDGVNFSGNQPGFAFGVIVLGGQPMPLEGYPFYLKNIGGTPLALPIAVTSTPANLDNVDLTKVHVILAPIGGGSVQNYTLQSLVATAGSGGQSLLSPTQLMPGLTAQYKLQIAMDSDAISGPGATINNVDFSFSGTALTQ